MRRASKALAALLLTSALSAGTARADGQSQQEAKDLFHGGAQAYAVGQFEQAVKYLDAAYALSPQPAILFSLSQALRRAYAKDQKPETLARAIEGFRKYLREVPQGPRVRDAAAAVTELELLQQKAGPGPASPGTTASEATGSQAELIVTSGTKGATIEVDGQAQLGEDGETQAEYWSGALEPGVHTIRVHAEGYFDIVRSVRLTAARPHALDIVLVSKPALLRVVAPAGTRVQVDGRLAGETPLPAALEVTPGTHVVALLKNGYVAQSAELTLARGATVTWSRTLDTSTQRKVAYVFGGASAASFVTSAVFLAISLEREARSTELLDLRRTRALTLGEADDYEGARTERNRYRSAGVAWLGVGVGLLGVGGLLYLFDQPSGGAERSSGATIQPRVGLGSIGLGGTF